MKIGVCTSPDKIPLIEELGYDFIESNFSWLASLSKEDFAAQSAIVERHSLAVEAYNIFFGGGIKLYAPDGNQDELLKIIADYADAGLARAASLGGKIAVIGSGGARRIPDDMTEEAVTPQFARVLNICGEAAERHGMKIVVEPLSDCNYIHTVAEGDELAVLSKHPAVGVLVDYFHHQQINDDLEALPSFADRLWHVHVARPGDRFVPCAEDKAAMAHFADLLKKCPGAERISLECNWHPNFDEAVAAARPFMDVFKKI